MTEIDWDTVEFDPVTGEMIVPKEVIDTEETDPIVKDSLGTILKTGDQVKVIKDLKVKGMSKTLKRGVDNYKIKLIPYNTDGVDCKIGKNVVELKASYLQKI